MEGRILQALLLSSEFGLDEIYALELLERAYSQVARLAAVALGQQISRNDMMRLTT